MILNQSIVMDKNSKHMLDRRRRLLGPAYRLFYREPVHIVRGEGVWLYDQAGDRYLDMYNNVPHVGHCHPHVVSAITDQVKSLNTHTRYLHANVLDYAERLTAKFPDELDTAMFSCTGSEANELALRIARTCTGGTGIIVTDFAYHGNTKAIYEISTEDIPSDEVPEYVVTVPTPDVYAGEFQGKDGGSRYAECIYDALSLLKHRGIKPAAFIIDTIISSGGVVATPLGYLAKIAEVVREAGALFVADEVQPGFGRTGRNFWGYQIDDFVPDIVTMGKPMGNGHPLAATVTRRELVDEFAAHTSYFNTFGGNPVSCAAGLAVLDVIENEKLQENALEVGLYLNQKLEMLSEKHEVIGDVRGEGLFKAVELVADRAARTPATEITADVVEGLRKHGILAGSIGKTNNILKLRPPMVFSKENAEFFIQGFDEVLCGL